MECEEAPVFHKVAAIAMLAILTGCSAMPSSGPTASVIDAGESTDVKLPYSLIDLDAGSVGILARRHDDSLSGHFRDRRPSPRQTLGVGDVVQVSIFEAGAGGLFSTSTGELGGGSKHVSLPPQVVGPSGAISVPYAGQIRVAGLSPEQVEESIEARLRDQAIEPQALVTIQKGRSNLATVTGEVGAPGRVELSPKGDRLLDVLATAGGTKGAVHDLFVQLTRRNSTAEVPFQAILESSSENIYVWPNDTIVVYKEPQVFTALGASGKSGNFPLQYERTTLAEAIAAASGLNDSRADPTGIFVYRLEDVDTARALQPGKEIGTANGGKVPVIYRLNLRSAEGIFFAKQVRVRNEDVIYVANSELAELMKFLSMVATVAGAVNGGVTVIDRTSNLDE